MKDLLCSVAIVNVHLFYAQHYEAGAGARRLAKSTSVMGMFRGYLVRTGHPGERGNPGSVHTLAQIEFHLPFLCTFG